MDDIPSIVTLEKLREHPPLWSVTLEDILLGHTWPLTTGWWYYEIRFFYAPWSRCRPQLLVDTRDEAVRSLVKAHGLFQ